MNSLSQPRLKVLELPWPSPMFLGRRRWLVNKAVLAIYSPKDSHLRIDYMECTNKLAVERSRFHFRVWFEEPSATVATYHDTGTAHFLGFLIVDKILILLVDLLKILNKLGLWIGT